MNFRFAKYLGAAVGLSLVLAGCGSTAKPAHSAAASTAPASASADVVSSGYKINSDLTKAALPADAQAAFDKALDGLTGADYDPIVLLGTQTVSGTNYSILCKVTPVVPNAESELDIVTVYADLDGNAQILNTEKLDLMHIANIDRTYIKDDTLEGAFTTNTEFTPQPEKDSSIKQFFQNSIDASNGNSASYQYATELGSQTSFGTNHIYLALRNDNGTDVWAVLTVYEDVYGNGTLSSVYELNPGAYTEYGSTGEIPTNN